MLFIRYLTAIFITGIILFSLFVYLVASNINESTIYKETDRYNYYSLTDGEIKKAPRISKDYSFEYHPGDGYYPSNVIIFNDATNPEPLRTYLLSLGYFQNQRRQNAVEVWCRPQETCREKFYLFIDNDAKKVTLTSILQ